MDCGKSRALLTDRMEKNCDGIVEIMMVINTTVIITNEIQIELMAIPVPILNYLRVTQK